MTLGGIAALVACGFGACLVVPVRPGAGYSARHGFCLDQEPAELERRLPRRYGAVPCDCGGPTCDGWRIIHATAWPGAG